MDKRRVKRAYAADIEIDNLAVGLEVDDSEDLAVILFELIRNSIQYILRGPDRFLAVKGRLTDKSDVYHFNIIRILTGSCIQSQGQRLTNSALTVCLPVLTGAGNIPFYCDPARTEHIAAFQKAGIAAYLANNRVLSGIEAIATLMKNNQFKIVYDEAPRFRDEIYKYVWKKNTGEPLKENDDVLCAIRYGIYSDMTVLENMPAAEQKNNALKLKGMLR